MKKKKILKEYLKVGVYRFKDGSKTVITKNKMSGYDAKGRLTFELGYLK